MRASRAQVVQSALDLFAQPRYLEIGVAKGATFHETRAFRKTAVDPYFKFDVGDARSSHPEARYFNLPSDAFFAQCPIGEKFDVIYIDGLHTFEQTLRDLMNALSHLADRSVIIIDDIFPNSLAAAQRARADFVAVREHLGLENKAWMGDVYKLVLFIDSFLQSWTFRCVSDNHGQLVMWQAPRETVDERFVSDIGLAGYERAIIERASFRFAPLEAIIGELREALAARPV